MLGVCSIMGLPWFVAATVLSISHVNSLKLESGCSAPGEQPKFLGIREQRVTGFMIFVLMGCSVFMTSVLKVRYWNCSDNNQRKKMTSNLKSPWMRCLFKLSTCAEGVICWCCKCFHYTTFFICPFFSWTVSCPVYNVPLLLFTVHSYASPVWSLSLHGCILP